MEFREKGTFKSETRFAPLLILSRRLVSVSADSEKLRFEPAHISHDPLARLVRAQNPSPSSVSYIIMSLQRTCADKIPGLGECPPEDLKIEEEWGPQVLNMRIFFFF